MSKKIMGLVFVLILLGVGGVFLWQKREIKGKPEDYVIKDTAEGKMVENKKTRLIVQAPEGWETKIIEVDEGAASFLSPNTEIEWRDKRIVLPIKSGCIIQSTTVYQKMTLEQIKEEAKYTHYMLGRISEEFEEIVVDNHIALKNTFDTQDAGPGIGIYLPYQNKSYNFYLIWAPNEKEDCIQEFDKFLDTISIK